MTPEQHHQRVNDSHTLPDTGWTRNNFAFPPKATDRLDQGPFGIEQDEGWVTIFTTTPSEQPVRNYGMGLIGYTWEESGPSLAARENCETLERHVEKLASLPFIDLLYIRCDWRDVQQKSGRLDFSPIWRLTLEAAKAYNLRVAFRIQLSNTVIQPQRLSMPDFLQDKIPLVDIGSMPDRFPEKGRFREPRYDHPEFRKAFRELNELLAAEFDNDPLIEFMDLMMYGFWGEGHTTNLPHPFPDFHTAEKTFVDLTRLQLEAWKKVSLAVNTQPDISGVGNRRVQSVAVRAGCWLRSDSIITEEPIQIDMLANRPPWLAVIMEDGVQRAHSLEANVLDLDDANLDYRTRAALHALDIGSNYWALWTEGENLRNYYERFPYSFDLLRKRLGYRVRPSWVWQRKRSGATELIVAFANDGVAGIPGILRVSVESLDGKVKVTGGLDAGQPYAGKIRQASFMLPAAMMGQKVRLKAEVESKGRIRRPVQWACAQPLEQDGAIHVQLLPEKDKRWRKGI